MHADPEAIHADRRGHPGPSCLAVQRRSFLVAATQGEGVITKALINNLTLAGIKCNFFANQCRSQVFRGSAVLPTGFPLLPGKQRKGWKFTIHVHESHHLAGAPRGFAGNCTVRLAASPVQACLLPLSALAGKRSLQGQLPLLSPFCSFPCNPRSHNNIYSTHTTVQHVHMYTHVYSCNAIDFFKVDSAFRVCHEGNAGAIKTLQGLLKLSS